MSEFLAEARILVRPDTSRFRRDLETQLQSVLARPVRIPVVPVVSAGFAAAAAGTAAFSAAQGELAGATGVSSAALEAATTIQRQYTGAVDLSIVATEALAKAEAEQALAAKLAAESNAANARSLTGFTKGVVAQTASLFGLRAGTLAASSAFIAGTVGVIAFSKAVQSAAALQTELNVFRVTADATADAMKRVSDEAKNLGRDITLPGVTATTAATAMTELAKAGLSVEDSLAGARGALELSTAAQIDVTDATKLVAGALNSFSLAGTEAVRVADLLTGAAKSSQGEITDMATALAQASAVAHLAGISIEDTVTFLTELAKAGISGGRAGTSLRVAILRLINPTAEAADKLKQLNIQVRDAAGNIRPQVFTDLATALQGLGKAQAQATLATIFGTDAVRAAAIIGADGAVNFEKLKVAVTEAGLAQEQAGARTQGLAGDFENLSNQITALGLTLGQVASGPVGSFVQEIAKAVSVMGSAADASVAVGGSVKDLADSFVGAIPGMERFLNVFSKIHSLLFLGPAAGGVKLGIDLAHDFGVGADKVKADAVEIRQKIEDIVKAGQQTGGDLGLNQTLVSLDLLVEQLRKGGPEAQKFAAEVSQLRSKLAEAGTSGFKLFPDNVESLFPPDLLTGRIAKDAGEKNVSALQKALSPTVLFKSAFDAFSAIGLGIDAAAPAVIKTAKTQAEKVVAAANEAVAKAQEQFDVARGGGSQAGELAALRNEEKAQQQLVAAAEARTKAIGAGNKGFATAVAARRKARDDLASTQEQIRGIEQQMANDAKKAAADTKAAADKIKAAASKREQALLSAQGLTRDRLQNKLAADAARGNLDAQIKDEDAIRRKVLEQIAAVRKRISVEGGQKAAIVALQAILIQIGVARKSLIEQQNADKKQQRDDLLSGIGLDISLDQIQENQIKEVADRKKLVVQLNKDLKEEARLHGTTTLRYKEIRNQIAEQNKAIDAITAEKKKGNTSFAQATFEFLQAQQGFASNLLGNLIPGGATGGLVGGGAPVTAALTPVAGAAAATQQSAFTSGQGNAITNVLFQMLQQLKLLNGSQATPEAVRQFRLQHSALDGVGGG